MRSVKQSTIGWSFISNCLIYLLLAGSLFASSPAFAVVSGATEYFCADDVSNVGSCTANEVSLSGVTNVTVTDEFGSPLTECVDGQVIKIGTLDAELDSNTGVRYDVTFWVGRYGNDPREPAGGDATACAATSLPDNTGSLDIANFEGANGDNCEDFQQPASPIPLSFGGGDATYTCNDSNGDGLADFQVLTTWQQNQGFSCGTANATPPFDIADPYLSPGSPSKCDFVIIPTIPIIEPASLTIVKNTIGGDDTFDFGLTGGLTGTAITTSGGTGSFTYTELRAIPDLDIFETLVPGSGWDATDITCTGATNNGTFTDSPTFPSVQGIVIDAGQDVVCTVSNTKLPSLTIVKNTVGGNGVFAVNWFGPTTSGGVVLDTGVINTDSDTIITTETGVFTLTELIPPGWVLGNAACIDDNGGGSLGTWNNIDTISGIDLSAGDSVTCTFTNQAVGTIMLAKNTIGGDGSFDFVTDVPGLGTNIQTSGGSGSATPATNVPTGTYSIVETVPAGWNLDSATCSNGSPPDALVLTVGDTVTCTFVNTKLGTVIVEKQTLPDGSAQTFDFTGNVAGTIADGGQITLANLLPGSYTSTETVPAGWDLTSIVCDDGESDTPSSGDTNTGTASFNLDAGETVTCVFTNTQDGTIEVIKSIPIAGPANETFNFTSNFNGNFILVGDAATTGPISVAPGSGYTVSEDDPSAAGWANTGISCGDGSDPLTNIEVSPGEPVVCTFTNTPLGSAVVIKDTVGGNGIFGFTGDAPIGPFSLDTTDQFTATTGDLFEYILDAGIYDVTEDNIPAGFELTLIECSDDSLTDVGTATASMDVQLAETVSCTFTNTVDGTLIIRKETLPDGTDQGFDFTGSAAGTIRDYSTFGEEIVVSGQPGIYTSAETVPAGWVISDISCTGDVQSTVTIGANDVSVDLAAGETVICTFENSVQGSITIEKFTQGGLGTFQFNSDLGSFPLDTLNNGNPDAATFSALVSDTYMFSEVVPTNWTLSDIQCSGATTSIITIGGAGGFDPGDQGVTIELNDGDSIVCTFVNDAYGSITVTKVTDPVGSPQSFDFTGSITASLTDGQSSTPMMVPAGNYDVSETALPGWDLTDISCNDDDSTGVGNTANFVVANGEAVTCTFTNTQRASITLAKDLPNDNGGTAEPSDFQAYIDGSPVNWGQTVEVLPDVQYTASEDTLSGYAAGPWGGACAPDGTVTPLPGETLICTITNDDIAPTLTLNKVLPNNNGGTAVPSDFPVFIDGNPVTWGTPVTLDAGQHVASETPQDGYTPSGWSIDCAPDGSVTLNPGDNLVCEITNDDVAPTLTLNKILPNDNGGTAVASDFAAFIDGNPVTWGVPVPLDAGPHIASETPQPGYAPSPWSNACAGDGSVTLNPGDNLVCEITNDDIAPTLALVKVVQNNNDGTAVETDWVLSAAGPTPLSGAGGVAATAVEAGTYVLSESVGPDGYSPSAWNCTAGTLTVDSLELPVGVNAICTIINSDLPSVINLSKSAAPATDVGGGIWEVVYTITASNSGQGPGVYDITDMMSPGAGITPVIDASYPAIVYAGGETQTGTLTTPPLANGGTWVTAEELAIDATESWTVTARFTVDPTLTDPLTNACDSLTPVINTGFYNAVSGSVNDPDLTDNETCTGLPDPVVNLAKTASEATNVGGNTWEVVYTITATNSGQGPGAYDITDTMSPGAGITPVVDASYPALAYAGGETQTGTLTAPPLANGGTWVTDEGLAAAASESWTVTARFTVDPAQTDPVTNACDSLTPVIDTGFYNAVSGSDSDPDLTDNVTCTGLGEASINLAKTSTPAVNVGGDTWEVVYTITATNAGSGPGVYDVNDMLMPGAGITPVIDASYPAIVYAGGETQSGVIATPPLVNGGTWVSLEALGGQQSESWTVTARFTVDEQALINSPSDADCILDDGEQGTGYMNFVDGSETDVDLSDNETCVPHILLADTIAVPTLSTWAMLLMILLMTGVGGWYFRPVQTRRIS